MVKILKAAGVKFAILGQEEQCCGDSARRLGNEYLYQILASTNMQTMHTYGVKKVITCCPHGYNTIKNEYAQFEQVVATELEDPLIQMGSGSATLFRTDLGTHKNRKTPDSGEQSIKHLLCMIHASSADTMISMTHHVTS